MIVAIAVTDGSGAALVARMADGVPEQVLERQRAEALRQRRPCRDPARDGDRVPAIARHLVQMRESLGTPCPGCAPRRIQAVQPIAIPHQRERIAADAIHGRLDHRQADGGGQGRIDGVAASGEGRGAGLRCQGLGRGDHVATQDRLPAGGIGIESVHGRTALARR